MSHYFRDLFPREAEAHDALIQRILDLRGQVERVSLGEFNAGDLPALLRVLDSRHHGDPSDEDMERLERKVNDLAMDP